MQNSSESPMDVRANKGIKSDGQKNEIGLDSSQNLSKFSISSLKMALNCL